MDTSPAIGRAVFDSAGRPVECICQVRIDPHGVPVWLVHPLCIASPQVPIVYAAEQSVLPSPPPGTEGREAFTTAGSRQLWYALRVKPRAEFSVAASLRDRGFAEFLPYREETVRWTDRSKISRRPLFAGYLFCRFDRFSGAADILNTTGVIQILGSNELSSISDGVIADLRRVVESPAPIARCPYVAGAMVTVARGPFAGVRGIVSRVKNGATLTIPIEILGRAVSVQIEAADIEKVAE